MTADFTRRPKIYVAGPMTGSGCPYANVGEAFRLATALWNAGWCPVVPHSSSIWAMVGAPFHKAEWLEYDFQLLADCAAVARISGHSPGAEAEEAFAADRSIPIYPIRADWATAWEHNRAEMLEGDPLVPEPGEPLENWMMYFNGVVA